MVVRDLIRYLLFSLLLFVCLVLPMRFKYWVACRLGDLNYFLLDIRGRKAAMANLRRVMPNATHERIVYETRWIFRNFAKYLVEFFSFKRFDKPFFEKHVSLKGREHIDAALAKGRGCIILSAHLSNWELGAAALSLQYGYPVNVVVAMHNSKVINRLFLEPRQRMGIKVIDMRNAGLEVMRALKRNEIVCILGDRDPTAQGVEVEFFGETCRFPQGPGRLAISTKTDLLPGYVLRRTNDSFTIVFLPALETPAGGSKEERVKGLLQQFAYTTEDAIRWHPDEWGVFYRIWDEEWTA